MRELKAMKQLTKASIDTCLKVFMTKAGDIGCNTFEPCSRATKVAVQCHYVCHGRDGMQGMGAHQVCGGAHRRLGGVVEESGDAEVEGITVADDVANDMLLVRKVAAKHCDGEAAVLTKNSLQSVIKSQVGLLQA